MRKVMVALAALSLLVTGSMAGCDDNGDSGAGSAKGGGDTRSRVGIILPDTKSSQRWKIDDPKYLKAAFDKAGVPYEIKNAEGDKAEFLRIADQMISSNVKVLMIVNLDSDSGKIVLDKARRAGIKTIDYDRMTLNGNADYYVSFNNFQVGVLQAQGLIECMKATGAKKPFIAEVNGAPTDNNATQFKAGYDSILQPLYDTGEYRKGPDQATPDWVNSEGGKIFEQMYEQNPNIKGVIAANDGLGGAIIDVLRKKGLNGKIPVTGQDATVQGLQNVLSGDQCLTIYKEIEPEANKASDLAVRLFKGEKVDVTGRIKDDLTGGYVKFVELSPKPITKAHVKDVVAAGFASAKEVCTGKYAQLCVENGVGVQ